MFLQADNEDSSQIVDAQIDLSRRCVHMSKSTFSHVVADIILYKQGSLLNWERLKKKCFYETTPIFLRQWLTSRSVEIFVHLTCWKFYPTKNENFQIKQSDIFHISAQNIDCGHSLEPPRRGGLNEYPQSMFLSRNKKNNVYPFKTQFYFIIVGFKRVKII